jgi:hypothetical protein
MAGNIFLKEAAAVVLQNDNGASTATGLGVAVGTNLDNRSAGNAAQNFWANFELKSAFGSAPAAGATIDLYLVPAVDGTNFADVTSSIPPLPYFVGSFNTLAQATSTRMNVLNVPLQPLLYKLYLVNASGQTMSANWGVRVVTAQEQFTP